MTRSSRWRAPLRALAVLLAGMGLSLPAEAKNPAQEALSQMRGETRPPPTIQNRFFTKANRFEIAPFGGYVPSNSFVSIPVLGAQLAYHFSETLAAEGVFIYGPDTGKNGVKNLTQTLLNIASDGGASSFQQPLDRFQLGALFGARWSPVYGKVNLVGEAVANFDWYAVTGPGIIIVADDAAVVKESTSDDPLDHFDIDKGDPQSYFAWDLGIGFDFFITHSVALKLDARGLFYYGPKPNYGTAGTTDTLESEVHSVFVTTGGISIFIPNMKNRVVNF